MEPEFSTSYVTADSLLYAVAHRPWLPPSGHWALALNCSDVLFAHYAVDPNTLRTLVPEMLELDTFGGSAWLSIAAMSIHHLRGNGLPSVPWLSQFCALNLRTYVTFEGKPGVFFFSLDSSSLASVWGARIFMRLPYWHAEIAMEGFTFVRTSRKPPRSLEIRFASRRIHGPGGASGMPSFRAVYKGSGEPFLSKPATLDHFLTERYCYYSVSGRNLYRCDIHHLPWPLQRAECEIEANTIHEPLGIQLPQNPDRLNFSRNLKMLAWGAEKLKSLK